DDRTTRRTKRKVRLLDDPIYHDEHAEQALAAMLSQEQLAAAAPAEELRVPRDLPPYLQELYRTPLLTPARERALFLTSNFHKFKFVTARRGLDPELTRRRHLDELETLLDEATQVKNAIVRANLRLVVSVA